MICEKCYRDTIPHCYYLIYIYSWFSICIIFLVHTLNLWTVWFLVINNTISTINPIHCSFCIRSGIAIVRIFSNRLLSDEWSYRRLSNFYSLREIQSGNQKDVRINKSRSVKSSAISNLISSLLKEPYQCRVTCFIFPSFISHERILMYFASENCQCKNCTCTYDWQLTT